MRLIIISMATITMIFSTSISAADYAHGYGALQVFDKQGMANAPVWLMAWIGFMMTSFLCGLAFVHKQTLARWVVGGMFAGIMAGVVADKIFGIPPLGGFIALLHLLFWSPGLYKLLTKRPLSQGVSAFSIWSTLMTLVILFSFFFDIRDASLYLMHFISSN